MSKFGLLVFSIFLSLLLFSPANADFSENAGALTGKWDILGPSDELIDTIDIKIVVSKTSTARFSFTQESHDDPNDSLEGTLINDMVIFELINLGQAQTYVAKINFDINGGPGFESKVQLADCDEGVGPSEVKASYREKLSSNSANCNGSVLTDVAVRSIKFLKQGVSAALVPTTLITDSEILAKEPKFQKKVEGAWTISGGGTKSAKRRIVIKDLESNYLGYQFTYKLLNNSTPLNSITQSDFLSASRQGYIIGNYMVLNSSVFGLKKYNEVFLLKLSPELSSASGTQIVTDNGICFPLKNPSTDNIVCTPNGDTEFAINESERLPGRSASKINTNVTISF